MNAAVVRRGLIQPRVDPFFADVITGLSSRPKTIPCKYLWDERGSTLFERLADVPEYYLTRAEREVLSQNATSIAKAIGSDATLVELGPGNASKTRILLQQARPTRYVPIDVDGTMLARVAAELRVERPELRVDPIVADYSRALPAMGPQNGERRVVMCAGSSIGNFHPHEAVGMLARMALLAGKGGSVLVGIDLKKSKRVIEAAYDDRSKVTAALNRNVLVRINREIGATFDITKFTHRAPYDPIRGRVEMRLVSEAAQRVEIQGYEFQLAKGEWIVTEHCYKYDLAEFEQLARRAGLQPVRAWTDSQRRVSLHELAVR